MIMSNFLKKRKSVREFRNKKVDADILRKIESELEAIEKEEGSGDIKFKLFEYGENLYTNLKGLGGYAGVMIESPHYVVMSTKNNEEKTIINSAYYMEQAITKLNNLGLATCWVSISEMEDASGGLIFGESYNNVNYILAFGYSKRKNPFVPESTSERRSVEEIVFDGEIGRQASSDDLEAKGLMDIFYYIRYAPSTKNLQPWRFLLKDNIVTLLLEYKDGEKPLLIDAGVIMYYFEEMAKTQGVRNKWEFIDGEEVKGDKNYKYVAKYKL